MAACNIRVMNKFRSKRFIAFCVGVALFILMIFTTDYAPIEVATGVTMITGIYIAGQSLRGSSKPEDLG